jgi:hypothetical protein
VRERMNRPELVAAEPAAPAKTAPKRKKKTL